MKKLDLFKVLIKQQEYRNEDLKREYSKVLLLKKDLQNEMENLDDLINDQKHSLIQKQLEGSHLDTQSISMINDYLTFYAEEANQKKDQLTKLEQSVDAIREKYASGKSRLDVLERKLGAKNQELKYFEILDSESEASDIWVQRNSNND